MQQQGRGAGLKERFRLQAVAGKSGLFHALFHSCEVAGEGFLHQRRGVCHCLWCCSMQLSEQGHDVEADEVAARVGHQVGAVGHVGLLSVFQIGQDVGMADAQERSGHMAVARVHGRQSPDARSAQQVEQQGFGLVVGVMAHADGLGSAFLQLLAEPLVAQLAGSHFYALSVLPGIGCCLEVLHLEGHAHLLA